jgi:hypothetical protein
MFRLLKVKPPHGWSAAAWELAVVTIGVMLALAAQQWVDERSWNDKVLKARSALRDELATHYNWSVEWRVVSPCALAQVDALQKRLIDSGAQLQPAPVYGDQSGHYVIRIPAKEYGRAAWDAALADGVSVRFDPEFRRHLNNHYREVETLTSMTQQNNTDYQALMALSRPIVLDPQVRFQLSQTLDGLRGRIEFMNLYSGQMIDHIEQVGMLPTTGAARRDVQRMGTYRFCKEQGLPMRPMNEAMTAVPN